MAADRLALLPELQQLRKVKVNPDTLQSMVNASRGRMMVLPRICALEGFDVRASGAQGGKRC